MNRFLIRLEEAGSAGPTLVGGKAAALGALLAAGFPVPDALCLTVEAYYLALAPYRQQIQRLLRQHNLADPAGARAAAAAIRQLLNGLALPAEVAGALAAHSPQLAGTANPLAVRSSATAEDRADASFAGQYESMLGVRGEAEVVAAILRCWRAFFSAPALAARAAHGALGPDEGMALLLQPLLPVACAGVAFSLDPLAQTPETVVVNAAWGFGGGVAAGTVAADTYRIEQGEERLRLQSRELTPQERQLALDAKGQLSLVPLAETERTLSPLTDSWAMRVAELALAAAAARGRPQEVEWAVAAGRLWLLQSRPLNGLPAHLSTPPPFPTAWQRPEDARTLWRFANLTGRERGPLMPLEHDYVSWRNFTFRESRRRLGAAQVRQARIFNGYTYMGEIPSGLLPGDRQVRAAAMEHLAARLRRENRTLWEHWGPEVVATAERILALDLETDDSDELADHLETTLGAFRFNWTIHPLLWVERPDEPLAEAYAALTGERGEAARPLLADLVQGAENALTRLLDAIYALAQTARETPAVAALVRQGDEAALARLHRLPVAAPFRDQLAKFLAEYGNRCGFGYGSEAMFHVPTWHEQPALVLRLLIPYLEPGVEPPAVARARRQAQRDAMVEALCAACPDPETVAAFRQELAYARRQAIRLEEHNHYIDQLTEGQLRRAIRAAGHRLSNRGTIASAEDIYWLRFQEIVSALRAPTPPELRQQVLRRRARYREQQQLVPPPLLGVPDSRLPERPEHEELVTEATRQRRVIPGQLQGQPASAGRHQGRARLVPPSELVPKLRRGEVLVAANVGPLWTPLFPILGGLVLDGGALAQHAAATAREYGIPAVIRTETATRQIPEGALVTVDGTAGTVRWET